MTKNRKRDRRTLHFLVGQINAEIVKMMEVDTPEIIKRNDTIEYRPSLCVREAIDRRNEILRQMAND